MASLVQSLAGLAERLRGGGGYYPTQWRLGAQLTYISVQMPVADSSVGTKIVFGDESIGGSAANPTARYRMETTSFFFDAIFRVNHLQELQVTSHPVQGGLADHAFLQPNRVTLEIGMSDAMASYSLGAYSGGGSKSVNAYQMLYSLQRSRLPITLTTRLQSYDNMSIVSLTTSDTSQTRYGLKASVTLQQLILATVSTSTASARPSVTGATPIGSIQPQAVPQGIPTTGLPS